MDEYIKREDAFKIIDSYSKACTEEGKVIANAIRDIVGIITPSADVVPKSEVEELIRENESLAKTVNEASSLIRKLRNKVEKSQDEIAREIFAELDNILYKFAYPSLTAIGTINVITAEGYHLHTRDYSELKKKYT